jgi:abortive infection bacteriophage resistance protein
LTRNWRVSFVCAAMRAFTKSATTFAQQIALLRSRGLSITNIEDAKTTLQRINYYRLSAYFYPFKNTADDTFQSDGSFEKALEFYHFDRELRLVVIDMLERIEVAIRCAISYHLAHTYGPWAHEDSTNFDARRLNHSQWISDVHRETDRSKEAFIEHFRSTYEEYPKLPIWVAAEIMSFGTLSLLYKGLHHRDQRAIAQPYRIHQRVFGSWLHCLAHVRNICAHHARLWNRDLSIVPMLPHIPAWSHPTEIPNEKKIYPVLCMLRFLSEHEPLRDDWARRLTRLIRKYDSEPRWLNAMGVPVDWATKEFWRDLPR